MIKIIDNRMEAREKDYLVFKVYRNTGDDTVYGYLIPHSEYDADEQLNFVSTERDVPVADAFMEAVLRADAFGKDFTIDFLWIQDLDGLFPVETRPDISHLDTPPDMLKAS